MALRGVRYALVGGVAVNLHGVPRMTYDIDLMVDPSLDGFIAADTALAGLGLSPRIPLRLSGLADASLRAKLESERNLVALTYSDPSNPLREVDVLIAPSLDPAGVVSRAVLLSAGDFDVRVATIEDIVAMKRRAGRPQDLADVTHLERILARRA